MPEETLTHGRRLHAGIARLAGALGLWLAAGAALSFSSVVAAAGTVYWAAPQNNMTFDGQVTEEVGTTASLVILRAEIEHPSPTYGFTGIVKRLKVAGNAPVLAYGFVTRLPTAGRSEQGILEGLDPGKPLHELEGPGKLRTHLLDMTDPALRQRIASRYVQAVKELGVDGFAIDRANRTPDGPPVITRRCQREKGFCEGYGAGMDAMFAELRRTLGRDAVIAYNGLNNAREGELADQARLLTHTNAAAIEYFGMDPRETTSAFSRDILPYLRQMQAMPADRGVLAFGRGHWHYTDYLDDYRWQRYLYASFLLAARDADMFKYHASFQVPAHQGRTGGLDRFADWRVDLGAPRGGAAVRGGLWVREFARGMVLVAPDDGRGGTLQLAAPRVTPEGKRFEGSVGLEPGTGLILLDQVPQALRRASRRVIPAQVMAGWGWSSAALASRPDGRQALHLQPLAPRMTGEHDVLLDGERSLTPYLRLEIDARLGGGVGGILAVAEVDDRQGRADKVVFDIGRGGEGSVRSGPPVPFRSTVPKDSRDTWPWITVARGAQSGPVELDGGQLLDGTGYRFRRWSHVRLQGPVDVAEIALAQPQPPLELAGTR